MKPEPAFRIRSYGVAQLASLYCPDCTPANAVRTLRRWIDFHPTCRQQLIAAGWRAGSKVLSPLMVKVIVDALGEP